MNDREALYRTICEDPDDDTPRLVFADWLQEHDDDARAEFIRIQCRLNGMAPSEPEYFELRVRERQLLDTHQDVWLDGVPRLGRVWFSWQQETPRYEFESATEFDRGFPCWLTLKSPEDVDSLETATGRLRTLVQSSPARVLNTVEMPFDMVQQVLASPESERLVGLGLLTPMDVREFPGFRVPGNVRSLILAGDYIGELLSSIRRTHSPGRLRELALISNGGWADGHVRQFFESSVCRGLEGLRLDHHLDEASPTLDGGHFPELRRLSLDIGGVPVEPIHRLATSGAMPKLDSLVFRLARPTAVQLADIASWNGRPLVELASFHNDLTPDHLQHLALDGHHSPLRSLYVLERSFGFALAQGLADPDRFPELRRLTIETDLRDARPYEPLFASELPELRSLWIRSYTLRTAERTGARAMAAALSGLNLPQLTHLNLSNQNIGASGAKVLAKRHCLTGLRSLCLRDCEVRDTGAKALFTSPHLGQLEFLDLRDNSIGSTAEALTDPSVLPSLARCRLDLSRLPDALREKLVATGRVTF